MLRLMQRNSFRTEVLTPLEGSGFIQHRQLLPEHKTLVRKSLQRRALRRNSISHPS